MRGLFLSGTDTGVGKSVLAAAIVAALVARGERVRPVKPVITGLGEPAEPPWPRDHELLGALAGLDPAAVSPLRFDPAVSPHLAAQLAGVTVARDALTGSILRGAEPADAVTVEPADAVTVEPADAVIVEGVGGLLVPLAPDYDVRDLIGDCGLPVVLAARPGLGTINHTLLTLEAARSAGLDVRGVVLTPWPAAPDVIARSNRETIARLGRIEVSVLAALDGPDPGRLAQAGSRLPLDDWLGSGRS